MLALVLSLLLPTPSRAAPWDDPVSVQDGGDLDGPGWPVEPVPGRFSVTWAPGIEPSGPHDAPPSPARIEAGPYTLELLHRISAPRYHTDAYELLGQGRPRDVARALGRLPGVVVAGPLLQTGPGAWRAATDRLILQTRDAEATRRAAEALGLLWIGRRGLAPGQVELRVPAHLPLDPAAAAAALRARPEVRWAQVDWLQPQQERTIPDDPRFPEQWHLDNTASNAGVEGNDLDAPEAWDVTMGRDDAIIAVLDSGVDLDHEDLADNLLPGFDFVDGVEGGATTGSTHGTRVSGVAAAPANGIGVVGVCPGCPILPGRVIGASDADQAAAHDWAVEQGAWVINDSWGPTDGTGQITPIAPVMAAAFESATRLGRGGLGTLIFWAAGNGNPADSCSMDGLVAHPLTIGVGASTDAGLRPNYSEMCPELELSSPSGGGSAGITTTVVAGYTSGFGGTSAAAPGAAGSAALLLSAVPDLRWEDARALLHLSATKIDPEGADYDERGHSDGYGYGRVNPYRAMQGGLLLDHSDEVVGCGANLGLRVVLPMMPGLGSVTATATASEDEESYDLVEGGAGIYEGTIELSEAPPIPGDGLLSVTALDTITVRSDQTVNVASLEVSCGGPILRDPHVEVLSPWAARLLWSTFDPSTGSAVWGAERGEAPLGIIHRVWALDLSPCTVYTADVDATDTLGNTATWPGALSWTTPGDLGLVPGDAPSGVDPCDPTTWQDDDDATPLFGDDDDTPAPGERPRFVAGPGCSCDGLQGALLLPLLGIRRRRRR